MVRPTAIPPDHSDRHLLMVLAAIVVCLASGMAGRIVSQGNDPANGLAPARYEEKHAASRNSLASSLRPRGMMPPLLPADDGAGRVLIAHVQGDIRWPRKRPAPSPAVSSLPRPSP